VNVPHTRFVGLSQEAGKLKNKPKYIELAVQKSGTIFTTRALKGLSEEHSELTQQYEKQQRSLVKEVVAIAGGSRGTLRRVYRLAYTACDP
jgi:DNA mismatch repair ATPase MutS